MWKLSGKANFSTITSRVKLVETLWTFIKRLEQFTIATSWKKSNYLGMFFVRDLPTAFSTCSLNYLSLLQLGWVHCQLQNLFMKTSVSPFSFQRSNFREQLEKTFSNNNFTANTHIRTWTFKSLPNNSRACSHAKIFTPPWGYSSELFAVPLVSILILHDAISSSKEYSRANCLT